MPVCLFLFLTHLILISGFLNLGIFLTLSVGEDFWTMGLLSKKITDLGITFGFGIFEKVEQLVDLEKKIVRLVRGLIGTSGLASTNLLK